MKRRSIMKTACTIAVLAMTGRLLLGAEQAADDPWTKLAAYKFGKSRAALGAVEAQIRSTPAQKYEDIENKLLVVLKTPEATFEAKEFVCRMLRQVGSEKCVPAMEELLTNESLSHMARFAIQGMPFPSVDLALRNALGKVNGKLKVGIISSIAARGDKKAVSFLKPLVSDKDPVTAEGAIAALGRIGGSAAYGILSAAKVSDGLKAARFDACLLCADGFLAEENARNATVVYRELLAEENPKSVRVAALIGLGRAEKGNAVDMLAGYLKNTDADLHYAAAKALLDIPGEAATKAILSQLSVSGPEEQVVLLSGLASKGDKSVAAEVTKMTTNTNDAVRLAAIQALATLGDAASVEPLAAVVKNGGNCRNAVLASLSRLRGAGVDETIVKCLPRVEPAQRAVLIASMAIRESSGVVPELLKYAEDSNETVRVESFQSLGALVGENELPALIKLMLKAKQGNEQSAAERAVQAACARTKSPAKQVEPLLAVLGGSGTAERSALLRIFGRIGCDKSLEVVRVSLTDKDEQVQETAVRVLSDWPNVKAIPDLISLAKNAAKENHRILALRGYVRLASMPSQRSAEEKTGMLIEAMKLAARPDEKKLVLGSLGAVPHVAALDEAEKYLNDDLLRTEAETACQKIAVSISANHKDRALSVLQKIKDSSKDENMCKMAEQAIQQIKQR